MLNSLTFTSPVSQTPSQGSHEMLRGHRTFGYWHTSCSFRRHCSAPDHYYKWL